MVRRSRHEKARDTAGVTFAFARAEHAPVIAQVRSAAARDLVDRFGDGHWSGEPSERAVLASMRGSEVLVARRGAAIVATCRLSRRKPWSIDTTPFDAANEPVYLTDMAVRPDYQGMGIGRALLAQAAVVVRAMGGDAIRLDAYDADAGAGEFYATCGFTFVGRATYRGVMLLYYQLRINDEP